MIIRRAIGNALRRYTGEVRGPGGGKFSEREHAQEEQYFRKKVHKQPSTRILVLTLNLLSHHRPPPTPSPE